MLINNNPVQLSEDMLYGKGYHKKCYLHPEYANLCIKIAYNEDGIDDLNREINYWKILNKRNKNYKILPKYYGKIITNKGEGYLFELIKNFDGTECKTLEEALLDKDFLKANYQNIITLLIFLKNELFNNEIITLDLFAHNVLLQKINKTEYTIRLVNDMGSAVFIPLEYYFHYFDKSKVKRIWTKFVKSLKRKYPSEFIDDIVAQIK